LLVPVAGLGVCVAAWWLYRLGRDVQTERARESFRLQKERLAEVFLKTANLTGKPRGLTWAAGTLAGELILSRDRSSKQISGLVAMDICFEPVPGGDMDDCVAAKIPRTVTAVFHFLRGEWLTEGRAIFNMTPEQVLSNFGRPKEEAETQPT